MPFPYFVANESWPVEQDPRVQQQPVEVEQDPQQPEQRRICGCT